jgi:hypothetical protein
LKSLHLINTNVNSSIIDVINSFPAIEKAFLFQNDRTFKKDVTLANEDLKKFDFGKYTLQ